MIEPFSVELTSNYSNGYFPDRVGSSLQWGSNIRKMVRGRENLTHKCSGTASNKIGSIFLHHGGKGESHTLSDRRQGTLVLPFENGGNKERTCDQIEQRNLILSSKSQNGYHSRNPALSTEYSSRQRVKKKNRLFRVASSSQSFSSGFSTARFSDNRSVCFLPMPPTTSIYSLAFRSLQSGDRCNDTKVKHRSSLCSSPFQYDFKSAPENKTGMCSSPDFNCTSLQYPAMVPRTLRPLPQEQEILISPKNIVCSLMVENSLTLAAWLVSGKHFCVKEFQKRLLTLS